jgi:hypothetical protein
MQYTDWYNSVKAMNGRVTTWPFQDDYNGQPAAYFSNAVYVQNFNAGLLPTGVGTQSDNAGQGVYVLGTAMAGNDVLAGAPATMTTAQQVENAVFTAGDTAAAAAGLPSLSSIESFLTGLGKSALIYGVIAVAGYAYLNRRR